MKLKKIFRGILRVVINAAKFIAMFAVFAVAGFFLLFAINIAAPHLINQVGENTTLKYSLFALALVIIVTVAFIIWMRARYVKLKPLSWWLIGGYAGLIAGIALPAIYMIIKASSNYIIPNNPYWG